MSPVEQNVDEQASPPAILTPTIVSLLKSVEDKDPSFYWIFLLGHEVLGEDAQLMIERKDIEDLCYMRELTSECIIFYMRYITQF